MFVNVSNYLSAEKFKKEFEIALKEKSGKMDYNIVIDMLSTEIIADDYIIIGNDFENSFILFYYKGIKTGKIYLKNIKYID